MILTYFDQIKRLAWDTMNIHEWYGCVAGTLAMKKNSIIKNGMVIPRNLGLSDATRGWWSPLFEFGYIPLFAGSVVPLLVVKSPFWWLQIVRTLPYSKPFQARFGCFKYYVRCFKSLATISPFLLLYLLSLLVNALSFVGKRSPIFGQLSIHFLQKEL